MGIALKNNHDDADINVFADELKIAKAADTDFDGKSYESHDLSTLIGVMVKHLGADRADNILCGILMVKHGYEDVKKEIIRVLRGE